MSPRTDGLAIDQITVLMNGLPNREHMRPSRTQIVSSLRRWLPGAAIHAITRRPLEHDEATLFSEITVSRARDDQEALLEGLAKIGTRHTLIFGNDAVLDSDEFLNLWPGGRARDQRFALFTDRILVLASSIRDPGRGRDADAKARDRFEFGLTEDLVKLKTLQILNTQPGSIEADVARAHWRKMLANNFVLVKDDRAGLSQPPQPRRPPSPKSDAFRAKVSGWLGRPLRSS